MSDLVPGAHCINVTVEPHGDNFRRVVVEWRDAAEISHRRIFMGASAQRVHGELVAFAAISEKVRTAYLVGLISAFTIISEKLPQLSAV